MDTITHALSGALIAGCLSRRGARPAALPLERRMIVGAAAAAFPDIDFALRLWDTLAYLNWHQGPTHSLVLAPLWAGLIALAFHWWWRRRYPVSVLFVAALAGVLVHIAGDLITAYGTMLFAPLTRERYALPLVFVIDPWLTLFVAGGVLALLLTPGRAIALTATLACAVAYVGLQVPLRGRALEAARVHAAEHGLSSAAVRALPQPFSPFHWALVVDGREHRHHAFVTLRAAPSVRAAGEGMLPRRMLAAYRPPAQALWRRYAWFGEGEDDRALGSAAWHAPALAPLRRFASLPVVWHIERGAAQTCVSFADLRFKLPELEPSFVYRACAAPHRAWRLERVRGAFWFD